MRFRIRPSVICLILVSIAAAFCQPGAAALTEPLAVHGFWEGRAGTRTQDDPWQDRVSLMETRCQLEVFTAKDMVDLKYKGDLRFDAVDGGADYRTREAWAFFRWGENIDITPGRQVLTWGTGDLVFLNDLFPKDWQSFFLGRDPEDLKAPSDAIKTSVFFPALSMDLVYTPKFDPDRYITGSRLSLTPSGNGTSPPVAMSGQTQTPDQWFRDHEIALRLYKNIANYELALYGYYGFWKTPEGKKKTGEARFPRLTVTGASIRGQAGPGIANLEMAWYHSIEDTDGTDPMIRNSEIRYLAGMAGEVRKNCTLSLQFYVEQMLDHSAYKEQQNAPFNDAVRQVITFDLTQLLWDQRLTLTASGYFCPTDEDHYLRPSLRYQHTDRLRVSAGANFFTGQTDTTFFARFENNSNVYASIRYSF